MRRFLGVVSIVATGGAAGAAGAADDLGGLPQGPGQEEAYAICAACHSIRMVTQQRLNRADWDEALVWMVEEQEMPAIEPEQRDLILDYLAKNYGRHAPR